MATKAKRLVLELTPADARAVQAALYYFADTFINEPAESEAWERDYVKRCKRLLELVRRERGE